MAKSRAELKRLERERAALNLHYCPAWIPGEAFESFLKAGAITDAEADDPEARARLVRLVFEAKADELSHCDTQGF